jgi:hypothetical protein
MPQRIELHLYVKSYVQYYKNNFQLIFKTCFMKRIYKCIFILLSLFFIDKASIAQDCFGVYADAYPRNPQSGSYNYYGIRVILFHAYNQDVTVYGYIRGDADLENQQYFSLTVYAGSTSAETQDDFFQTDATGGAAVVITQVSPCPAFEITASYAGVTIAYEINNNVLRFNSINDVNTVLDQLDADYDNWNDSYDNNYDPNLTADQMDDIDAQTGFDEFRPFRNFENLFSGYNSIRMDIESMETNWLNSNFTSTDPDNFDITFDDAANTILNSSYSFKVGTDVYQLTVDGMYVNGVLQASMNNMNRESDNLAAATGIPINEPLYANAMFTDGYSYASGPSLGINNYNSMKDAFLFPDCKSNKFKTGSHEYSNEKYKLKVAVNSWLIRSGAKGKVIHYKWKNGRWKRSRAKMAVYCGGNIYSTACTQSFSFSDRKPAPNGWKKRRQLKVARHQAGTIWRTKSGELASTFDTEAGHTGNLTLTY